MSTLPPTTFKDKEDFDPDLHESFLKEDLESIQSVEKQDPPHLQLEDNEESKERENVQSSKTYRSKPVDPFKNIEQTKMEELLQKLLFLKLPSFPTGTNEQYVAFQKGINVAAEALGISTGKVIEKVVDNLKTDADRVIFRNAYQTLEGLNEFSYGDIIKNENPTNDLHYGGIDQVLPRKQLRASGTSSPEFSFARFQALLGLGHATIVTLYHSGFKVVLNPPTQAELLKLQIQIFESDQELGYSTSGYFNNAKKSRVVSILKEYIQSKVITYTLDVDKQSLFDYISYLDLETLILGLIRGAYDYVAVSRTCFNALDPNIESKRCTHTVEAKLNPAKLLQISRAILTDQMLNTLSKEKTGVVSIPEQANYVVNLGNSVTNYRNRKDKFTKEINGRTVEIKFKIPTINEYIQASEEWIAQVERELDNLVSSNNELSIDKAKSTIDTVTRLSNISSGVEYVKIITDDQEVVFTDNNEIINILQGQATTYDESVFEIQDAYIEFINKSPIAYVATPAYECPSCKSLITDNHPAYDAEKLIGFNLIDFFFNVVEYQKILASSQIVID